MILTYLNFLSTLKYQKFRQHIINRNHGKDRTLHQNQWDLFKRSTEERETTTSNMDDDEIRSLTYWKIEEKNTAHWENCLGHRDWEICHLHRTAKMSRHLAL